MSRSAPAASLAPIAALAMLAAAASPVAGIARAQGPPAAPSQTTPTTQAAPPAKAADPQTVLLQLNDLGLLRSLQPLKFTSEQITKLLDVLRTVDKDRQAIVRQDEEMLRGLAADVQSAHAAALTGVPVPAELESRVASAAKAADDRRRRALNAAVQRVLVVAKTVLTPEQREQISVQSEKALGGKRIPAEYKNNPSRAPKEAVLDLATGAFIERVLFNERAIEVLSQMKPAEGSVSPAPASAAP